MHGMISTHRYCQARQADQLPYAVFPLEISYIHASCSSSHSINTQDASTDSLRDSALLSQFATIAVLIIVS